MMPVQQQLNNADCGVLAVAFAISLLFDKDPVQEIFHSSSVRSHPIKCLKCQYGFSRNDFS